MQVFSQGLIIGLAYVAPIGMQNLFVIQNALTNSSKQALLTAIMVIINDISLALACFFGIGHILETVPLLKLPIGIGGTCFVLYISYTLWNKDAVALNNNVDFTQSLTKLFFSCFAVTWLNPQALIDGTLLFGGIRASLSTDAIIPFILGTCCASIIWFLGIAIGVFKSKKLLTPQLQIVLNKTCALILLGFGIKLGLTLILL